MPGVSHQRSNALSAHMCLMMLRVLHAGVPPTLRNVTHLVQHPIPLEPPAKPAEAPALPVMLTKKERKKIRMQKRKAEERETQEKIRLGLLEAPAPKVKKANFMRVLGMEAVADPTKIEHLVNAQMDIRQREHEKTNAARALTKDQKRAKVEKKLNEDTSLKVEVAVFRVNDLTDGQKKYKVDGCSHINRFENTLLTQLPCSGLTAAVDLSAPRDSTAVTLNCIVPERLHHGAAVATGLGECRAAIPDRMRGDDQPEP